MEEKTSFNSPNNKRKIACQEFLEPDQDGFSFEESLRSPKKNCTQRSSYQQQNFFDIGDNVRVLSLLYLTNL
jgi:hypothetical protein